MYCWNCGKEIDEKVTFCPHCGIKQAGAPEPRREKQKGVLLPVICAAVCVGALLTMILLLAGDKEDPAPQVHAPAITQEKAEPETTQAPTVAETTKPTETKSDVDPYGRALPDLKSFLGTEYTQDEWGYTHYVTCLVDRDDKDSIVHAVLDLLQEPRYQLDMMDEDTDSDGTHYTFAYTGKNGDIDWVYLKAGGKYHVKLTVKPYGSSQTALIMYSYPEFYLEDPGVRWDGESSSSGTSGSSGSSGSFGSSSTSTTKIKTNCTRCFGSGEVSCSNCSGMGYKVKRESVPNYSGSTSGSKWAETKETCYKCHGSGEITCSRCGGSGKQ